MNDVEIKKDMYKEFENKDNIINIKEELLKSMNNLKEEELIHSNNFRLEDTMSAFVINHYKMDPHCHNEKISLINDNNKKLEKLYSFSYKDTLYTISDIFRKEMSLFYNVPIHGVFLENTLAFITEENIDIKNFTDLSKINYNTVTSFLLSFKYVIYLLFLLKIHTIVAYLISSHYYIKKKANLHLLNTKFLIYYEIINILHI